MPLPKITSTNEGGQTRKLPVKRNVSDEISKLRETQKWKNTYQRFLFLLHPDGGKAVFKNEESYKKHIDKLSKNTVDNKNLIGSWNSFKPDDYDSKFKEDVAQFGSEEAYYAYLDKVKEKMKEEQEQQ